MIRIYLFGTFDVRRAAGGSLRPRSKKEAALIALVASATRQRCTRSWIKSVLWPEKSEEAASANLRQALWRLRGSFGVNGLIQCDADDVWLMQGAFEVMPPEAPTDEFMQGFDLGEEPFEDWLREQRASRLLRRASAPCASHREPPRRLAGDGVLAILLQPPVVWSSRAETSGIARKVSREVAARVREMTSAMLLEPDNPEEAIADDCRVAYVLRLEVTASKNLMLMTAALRARDGRTCAEVSVEAPAIDGPGLREALHIFSERAGVTFCAQIHADAAAGAVDAPLLLSIYDLYSTSSARQKRGVDRIAASPDSGLRRAWLAYGQVVCGAECAAAADPLSAEHVAENCARALEHSPYDPIVNALTGHIAGFFFRDRTQAEERLSLAYRLAPYNSTVISFCAAAENYFGQPKKGIMLAQRAVALNPNGLMRFVFDCDLQMGMALTGRHREAVELGERALRGNPKFLGARRYLAASYVHAGDMPRAHACIDLIQAVDPAFTAAGVRSARYPLPSDRSVEIVESALRHAGR